VAAARARLARHSVRLTKLGRATKPSVRNPLVARLRRPRTQTDILLLARTPWIDGEQAMPAQKGATHALHGWLARDTLDRR